MKVQNLYVSEVEKFLNDFNETHPKLSESQLADIKKHTRISRLRDEAATENNIKNTLD